MDLDGDESQLLPDLLAKLLYALTYNRQIKWARSPLLRAQTKPQSSGNFTQCIVFNEEGELTHELLPQSRQFYGASAKAIRQTSTRYQHPWDCR